MLVGAAEAIHKPATLGPLLLGINTLLYRNKHSTLTLSNPHCFREDGVSFDVTLSVPLDLGQAGLILG